MCEFVFDCTFYLIDDDHDVEVVVIVVNTADDVDEADDGVEHLCVE